MDDVTIFLLILCMALVTYLPRVFPLFAFSDKKLPDVIISWLRYVPAAVLSAMLLPTIMLVDGKVSIGSENLFFLAAVPTFITAILTRSLFPPVIVGMVIVVIGRLLL